MEAAVRPSRAVFALTAVAAMALLASPLSAQLVPGTGFKVDKVGDDFEDPAWDYVFNLPKSSNNLDEQIRGPGGRSRNGRWEESGLRGQPDVIRRVSTPPDGLPGSTGALAMRSLNTGVPNRVTNQLQQDDLIMVGSNRLGGRISASRGPSAVVRVWLPPFDDWEPRTGNSFGMRADCQTHTMKKAEINLFSKSSKSKQVEEYWPGIFIYFNSKSDGRNKQDSAHFLIRANRNGGDIRGPGIEQTGWWTLGMSITPDGMVHYYARPGVENLTAEDHITSQYPYGYRCEHFNTIFFNVANQDNGRSWSTEWIIDDPQLFLQR
jgi:hypothetical protein